MTQYEIAAAEQLSRYAVAGLALDVAQREFDAVYGPLTARILSGTGEDRIVVEQLVHYTSAKGESGVHGLPMAVLRLPQNQQASLSNELAQSDVRYPYLGMVLDHDDLAVYASALQRAFEDEAPDHARRPAASAR